MKFGNAALFPAKFHFALTDWSGDGVGHEMASASAFPNEIWEREDVLPSCVVA